MRTGRWSRRGPQLAALPRVRISQYVQRHKQTPAADSSSASARRRRCSAVGVTGQTGRQRGDCRYTPHADNTARYELRTLLPRQQLAGLLPPATMVVAGGIYSRLLLGGKASLDCLADQPTVGTVCSCMPIYSVQHEREL